MPNNPKQTGKGAAKEAGKELASPKSPPGVKKVAGSDLSQAPFKNRPKRK